MTNRRRPSLSALAARIKSPILCVATCFAKRSNRKMCCTVEGRERIGVKSGGTKTFCAAHPLEENVKHESVYANQCDTAQLGV
jgi:hypothetical protein